ncbi:hypothetical protein [Chroococcidiopsis sp.]|uniref:hypothetical protein n=1 Tax=Chroococcidiopsis sp. TaxID=3088168 RepID=UPI003F36C020
MYYLFYACGEGLQKTPELGEWLAWIVYIAIEVSRVLHGTSATPLMNWYEQKFQEKDLEQERSST